MTASAAPEGYGTLNPYLMVHGCAKAIDFYREVFGAEPGLRLDGPGGVVGHAEVRIGDSTLMMADVTPDIEMKEGAGEWPPMMLMVYVADVDATFAKALAAGARQTKPVQDQFYGDRTGSLVDPFGHHWTVATHTEDVPEDEMKRRMAELYGAAAG